MKLTIGILTEPKRIHWRLVYTITKFRLELKQRGVSGAPMKVHTHIQFMLML